jgi:DNA-binding transcriptional LysR family regulator
MHLELRHLRYFLAVAEELSFSRAAKRLHIAQPALSAQIRAIETQLGCQLFFRTTRRVELTVNGRMLVGDARAILALVDEAVAKQEAAARGEQGVLRIGFVAHGAGEIGAEIQRRFAESFPAIETGFIEAMTLEEVQRHLRERESDVAFVWPPLLFDELEAVSLCDEGLCACMSAEHRLSAMPVLRLQDLAGEPIVAKWDGAPWQLLRPWLGELRPGGRRPGDPSASRVSRHREPRSGDLLRTGIRAALLLAPGSRLPTRRGRHAVAGRPRLAERRAEPCRPLVRRGYACRPG